MKEIIKNSNGKTKLSMIIMGAGQLAYGRIGKGLLFLLSEVEIFGSTTYSFAGEGSQYAWYKAGNTKVKKVNGSAGSWWERSPYSGGTTYFCNVGSDGNATTYAAGNSYGVSFGFCV